MFLKMEDDLTFLKKEDLKFFENGRQPQKKMQPKTIKIKSNNIFEKTIKSKNNGCGTAPGNQVVVQIINDMNL